LKKITIYTMERCPFCKNAKSLLTQRGLPFEEILLSMQDDAAWESLEKKSGMKTVPVIYANQELIGGYTELKALDDQNQLAPLKIG
jgi:glutaredoxin 3